MGTRLLMMATQSPLQVEVTMDVRKRLMQLRLDQAERLGRRIRLASPERVASMMTMRLYFDAHYHIVCLNDELVYKVMLAHTTLATIRSL